jgi:hypothetical protein
MMSWSPTVERNAISGLAAFFARQIWRDSRHGLAIRAVVRNAIEDQDDVNRLHAADVARWLEPEPSASLALLRARLLHEPNDYVAAVLINQLGRLAATMTVSVDATIGELFDTTRWQARLATDDSDSVDTLDPLISLVLWLAIRHEAVCARPIVQGWCSNPTTTASKRSLALLRPWFALPPDRAAERHRAFEYALTAAEALEQLRGSVDLNGAADVYQTADTLVDQIYFASGAFGTRDNDRMPTPAQLGFAEEAFAVLEGLTEFRHPSITHHIVETLGHLAPTDPVRAFLLVERSIRPGDEYTYDSLAADTTVSLIERYLAEFRSDVLADARLLTAVRTVLDAFVRVGWSSAVALSYRLSDAFR